MTQCALTQNALWDIGVTVWQCTLKPLNRLKAATDLEDRRPPPFLRILSSFDPPIGQTPSRAFAHFFFCLFGCFLISSGAAECERAYSPRFSTTLRTPFVQFFRVCDAVLLRFQVHHTWKWQ